MLGGFITLNVVERNTKVIQFSCTPTLKSHKPNVPSAAIAIWLKMDIVIETSLHFPLEVGELSFA
ncbi:hypothetical protein HMPREF3034_01081 [Prevotella sp. DNF00663]|nr:hypothetical protein HMPREF0671_01465 [Prevotella sp. S7 MS 2]KXB83686.1 hypothetical protein HMPREF3034_01081 [Prevotella sp. DNF00663]